MTFTWGIITDGDNPARLDEVIRSIRDLKMPDSDIIVCGGEPIPGVTHIPYDLQRGWITRKKNEITRTSGNDVIAFCHDYLAPCSDFWEGLQKFGWDWDVCMTRIVNIDGMRFRDWSLSPDVELPKHRERERLLPYCCEIDQSKMYVSGAFWMAKREFMLDHMLNEDLMWGQGEDVEWSKRALADGKYVMNGHSTMRLLKAKRRSFNEIGVDLLKEVV